MNNNEYIKYIEELIPTTFNNIYVIDMMSDLVLEYAYENKNFIEKNKLAFTNFYTELEKIIHPEDLNGYINSITINNLQEHLNKGNHYLRFDYRKKLATGEYNWFTNVVNLIDNNGQKAALVLVENVNENIEVDKPKAPNENLEAKQKMLIDVVSNSIIKLNSVMNINAGSNNPEIKSMTDYVNNILIDLSNSVPEINEAVTANMIANTNQGTTKTLLVVDDDTVTCKLLTKTFEDLYKIVVANNGQEAIDILEKNNDITNLEEKDKIVGMFLDLNMPIVDGFGVLDYMSSKNLLSKMPVIIISGDYDQETKDRAYLYKIADVLEKPFNVQVVKHRIKTLVKLYKSNNSLNEIVLTQHQDIKNIIKTIVKSYLYDYANEIKRISSYTGIIARQLNEDYNGYNFDENRINKLMEAVKYYNIGLYTLPHKMFKKQNFTADEIKIIKSHPSIGLSIFDSVLYRNTDSIFNHFAKDIILYHEEKYDGTGYPTNLVGDKIPVAAQIASVAIEYNELLKTMNEESILNEIVKGSGTKFNPKVVESLKRAIEKIKQVNK